MKLLIKSQVYTIILTRIFELELQMSSWTTCSQVGSTTL